MTQIGASGFSFIDQEAKSAQSLDQLEWIVAHNISHELMLSFGVRRELRPDGQLHRRQECQPVDDDQPECHLQPGRGPGLEAALASNSTSTSSIQGAQVINGQTVPEPSTVACWLVGLSAAALMRRKLTVTR